MTPQEEIQALKKIILDFGDAAADVFEQMIKGDWVDDHDHPVRNNISMIALAKALNAASNYAAQHEGEQSASS